MPLPPDHTYVLCFLTRGARVLMLHRSNPPNRGLWNGVGGHLNPAESPRAACLREVQEETGFVLPDVHFAGLLTWADFPGHPDGGLYIFTAPAPPGEPKPCEEGQLAWKTHRWVCSAPDVVENIHHFAPLVLDGAPPQVYHFDYGPQGQILQHELRPLPAWAHDLLDGGHA